MKQLLQHLDSGETELAEVPRPAARPRHLVVCTRTTLVSAGTERMLLEFGRANLFQKALQQPERVKDVLEKVRAEGLVAAWDTVSRRLEEPLPLGYCQAGRVVEVGDGVSDLAIGDRVVTSGPHAEWVQVPRTLAVPIPEGVEWHEAAFGPLGAVAVQGARNAEPTLGETFVVFGLGLVGLLSVQVLRANGCRVLGIDPAPERAALGKELGATVPPDPEDMGGLVRWVRDETNGMGADGVLLALSSESDDPVHQAAQMCRKKGRLVLVGVTGLDLRRADFYEKELSLTVSCSLGPGRYDPDYEEEGRDYPLPYVRWTAQRNVEAFVALVARGDVDVEPLISHRYPFERAHEAYERLADDSTALGIVLEYDGSGEEEAWVDLGVDGSVPAVRDSCAAGVIGAGGFAQRVFLPVLSELPVELRSICAPSGTSAGIAGRRFGFARAVSDPADVLGDDAVNVVFVLTRHDTHAEYVVRALEAGKHVFVEKPLALSLAELDEVRRALEGASGLLTVGFNRRFAPRTAQLEEELAGRSGPLSLQITVNAGHLPGDHWLLDPAVGGGRLVGEGCHYVDLARALTGSRIEAWELHGSQRGGAGAGGNEPWHLSLGFADGSVATVHYLPTGSPSYPKERVAAFFDGKTFIIENWKRLVGYGGGPLLSIPRRQDKGHEGELEAWIRAVTETGEPPIPYEELFEVSRVTLDAAGQGDP